jgi:cytochrome oxidase assembly protein ShyY1
VRGGESAGGEPGYFVLVDCADPAAPGLLAVAGWTARSAAPPLRLGARLDGILVARSDGAPGAPQRYLLVARNPVPPLGAPRLPSAEELPNNHLAYAIQWFAFAATLAAVYLLYLRRWRRERAPSAR